MYAKLRPPPWLGTERPITPSATHVTAETAKRHDALGLSNRGCKCATSLRKCAKRHRSASVAGLAMDFGTQRACAARVRMLHRNAASRAVFQGRAARAVRPQVLRAGLHRPALAALRGIFVACLANYTPSALPTIPERSSYPWARSLTRPAPPAQLRAKGDEVRDVKLFKTVIAHVLMSSGFAARGPQHKQWIGDYFCTSSGFCPVTSD